MESSFVCGNERDLARVASENHVRTLSRVYEDYRPDPALLEATHGLADRIAFWLTIIALAVGTEVEYAVMEEGGERYILAAARLDDARLALARHEVRAPAAGIVMQRLVAPGARVMLEGDGPWVGQVLHTYRPERLQVRVDVPGQGNLCRDASQS